MHVAIIIGCDRGYILGGEANLLKKRCALRLRDNRGKGLASGDQMAVAHGWVL